MHPVVLAVVLAMDVVGATLPVAPVPAWSSVDCVVALAAEHVVVAVPAVGGVIAMPSRRSNADPQAPASTLGDMDRRRVRRSFDRGNGRVVT